MSYQHQELTRQIIGATIEVHKILGPGLLESAYRQCLFFEDHLVSLLKDQKAINAERE